MLNFYYNSLLALSVFIVSGAGVYRLYRLDYIGVFLSLLMAAAIFSLLKKTEKSKQLIAYSSQETDYNSPKGLNLQTAFLLAIYCLLLTSNFFILLQSRTAASIISPWQAVPWYFFITFGATTLLLIFIALKVKLSEWVYLLLLTFYFLLAFSVAVIVYQIGFGFDPFIHQATEKLIAVTGAVYPKPLYYLGQYGLIVSLHKLLFIPIVWLDVLLVPVMAAVLLPVAFYNAFKTFFPVMKTRQCLPTGQAGLVSTVCMLILPFSIFTVTAPQNLAYLFLILTILASLQIRTETTSQRNLTYYFLLLTLPLATLAIHPIAGIPAVLFVAMLYVRKIKNKRLLFAIYCLLFTTSVLALPAAFALTNRSLNTTTETIATGFQLPEIFFSDTGSVWLNFAYLYGFNVLWILLALIVIGIFLNFKKRAVHSSPFTAHLLMSFTLILSYLITKFLNFSYLISYERSNFADRILVLAVIFALPFIMVTIATAINKISQQERAVQYLFYCFFIFLLTSSLYYSYPRFDDYFNSRSYSTSQADVEAVRWIETDAGGHDYIALANQQVSAAALEELGFKRYYPSKRDEGKLLFYYPIPTGDALYQYYLDMVYGKEDNPPLADALRQQSSVSGQASRRARKTALEAASLVGVDTVYFVLNDYWFGFEKILAQARMEAQAVQRIGAGEDMNYIFKYTK